MNTTNATPLQLSLDINANPRPGTAEEARALLDLADRAMHETLNGSLPQKIAEAQFGYYCHWWDILRTLPQLQTARGKDLARLLTGLKKQAEYQDTARNTAEMLYRQYSRAESIPAVLA